MYSILSRGIALGVVAGFIVGACSAAPAATSTPVAAVTALAIHADTVQGPANLLDDERSTTSCVQKNRFARNEQIVWRVSVTDPVSGEPMDDTALSAVAVKLPDQQLPMRWGGHPRDNPLEFFWTVSWTVPEGYPSGQLPFTVEATAADGRSGTFNEFKVASAQLAVTEDVRPTSPPTAAP